MSQSVLSDRLMTFGSIWFANCLLIGLVSVICRNEWCNNSEESGEDVHTTSTLYKYADDITVVIPGSFCCMEVKKLMV